MPRGLLIVFEGAEGAGKTTQLKRLADWLGARGRDVVAVREPGGTARRRRDPPRAARSASDITPRAEALLFMASRAQLVEREIRPALDARRRSCCSIDSFSRRTRIRGADAAFPKSELRAANAHRDRRARARSHAAARRCPSKTDSPARWIAAVTTGWSAPTIEFHERVARAFADFATSPWQAAHAECGTIVAIDGRGTEREVFARVIVRARRALAGGVHDDP